MPRILNLTDNHIAAIEKAFNIKLLQSYVAFMTRYPFPDLAYMRAEDLIELHEMNAELIIAINENLRDPNLNPFVWQEHYLSVGERAGDEAIFYIEIRKPSPLEGEGRVRGPGGETLFEQNSATPPLTPPSRGGEYTCPVFVLEPGAEKGVQVAEDFAQWADARVLELLAEDEKCINWQTRQSRPWWQIWRKWT